MIRTTDSHLRSGKLESTPHNEGERIYGTITGCIKLRLNGAILTDMCAHNITRAIYDTFDVRPLGPNGAS